MRIRRRATVDVLHHPQVASSAQTPSPAAPPPPPAPAPAPAPASCSENTATRWVLPPVRAVDLSMCEAKPFDPGRPSGGQNHQDEEKGESDKTTEDEKRGEQNGRSEHEHGRPVHAVCSTRAEPKREEEERRTEEEEEESEDSAVRVKDEEKAAAMCKKGDGKGWHCKRAAQCGYSLCQYHLDKLRSYGCYSQKKKTKKKKPNKASAPVSEKSTAAATHRQGASPQRKKKNKRRRLEEHALSTGSGVSDSFYYYSGFGPRWGRKRRGDRPADATYVPDGGASRVNSNQGCGDAAAVAGGEEDEYECEASSRGEKPPKSRALSSLL